MNIIRLVIGALLIAISIPLGAATSLEIDKIVSNTADGAFSVTSADLNSDGFMDVVVGSAYDNKVAWYRNNGNKTFSTELIITTDANNLRSVHVADLNNDGHIDVLSASVGDSKVAWYKNKGNGEFDPTQLIISNNVAAAHSVFAADMDNDGDQDVLSGGYGGGVYLHRNQGVGEFSVQQVIANDGVIATVHANDFDNDGDMDVVFASMNEPRVVWYRNDQGAFTEQQTIDIEAVGFIDSSDIDNDGDIDLVLGGGDVLGTGMTVLWHKNDGKGGFSLAETMTNSAQGVRAVYAADMDKDGDEDVIATSAHENTVLWFENNNGVMSSAGQIISNTVNNGSSVYASDLDNDGDLDVLAASIDTDQITWYENLKQSKASNFGDGKRITASADGVYSVFAADLDSDGKMDIISGSAGDNKVAWYKNNGDKTFSSELVITQEAYNLRAVHAADLNNDGHIDVISASVNDNKIAWYQNNGDGTISTTQKVISNSVALAHDLHPVDLDLDGDIDVISVGYSSGNSTYWHENLGDGSFADKKDIGITGTSASVHAVDVDNDGDQDIITASMSNNNVVWFRNDRGSFSEAMVIDTLASGFISSADIDSDGDADLVLGGGDPTLGNGTTVAWYKNDGKGNFSLVEIITNTANGVRAVFTADFDTDGDSDILTATRGGVVSWYENTGGKISKIAKEISNTVTNASSVHATDLDNDGDVDVISASIDKDTVDWYENSVDSEITHGTVPIGNLESIKNLSIVTHFLSALPVKAVDTKEVTVTDSAGVKRLLVTGDISFDIPGLGGGAAITMHGGELLVLAETPNGATAPKKDAIFIKYKLYDFLQQALSLANLPQDFLDIIPNVEMLIAYSNSNLDETAIKDLPEEARSFFKGVLSEEFGIPIFSSSGSINVFLPRSLESFPAFITKPLAEAGITSEFVKETLGVDGSLLSSLSVTNINFIVDLVSLFFPNVGSGEIGSSPEAIGVEFGIVLPAVSMPEWLKGGVGKTPIFAAINFEPDASVQFRQALSFTLNKDILTGANFSHLFEAALKIKMPNILNADSLKDEPGKEPLDVRATVTTDVSAGGTGAEIGMQGSLQLTNDWVTPLGIPGISVGQAVISLSGSGKVDTTVAGAGGSVGIGIAGQFSCLDENDKPIGTPREAAQVLKLDVLYQPPVQVIIKPEHYGIYSSLPNMTLQQSIRCAVGVQTGVILGMGDSLIAVTPEASREEVRNLIQSANGNIKDYINTAIEKPLEFEPIAFVMNQLRVNNAAFYFATPGATIDNYITTTGLKLSAGLEYREDEKTENWKNVGSLDLGATLESGAKVLADFAIGDFALPPALSMYNNRSKLELKLLPPTADLNISGNNKFFEYESNVDVEMGLTKGVKVGIDSKLGNVASQRLSLVSVTQDFSQFLDPNFRFLDFKGTSEITYNPEDIIGGIHAAVGSITQGAQAAYRNALNDLEAKKDSESSKQRKIDELVAARKKKVDEINAQLQPAYNLANSVLSAAHKTISSNNSIAKGLWRKHNNEPSWKFWVRGPLAVRARFHEGLARAANFTIPKLTKELGRARSLLTEASKKVTEVFDPEINALRVELLAATKFREIAQGVITGLQAANNAVNDISDGIKDASSIKVHTLRGTMDSLVDFDTGKQPLSVFSDIELVASNLRCKNTFGVYNGRVDQLISGLAGTFKECINQRVNSVSKEIVAKREARRLSRSLQAKTTVAREDLVNDDPEGAIVISGALPLSISGNNAGATLSSNEFSDEHQESSVWWQWQPNESGIYELSVSGGGDTAIHIHQDNGNDLTGADSLLVADTRLIDEAKVTYYFDSSTVYYIAVSSQFDDPGAFQLNIQSVLPEAIPENDNFDKAFIISGLSGNTTGNNLSATIEEGETPSDGLPAHHSLWWDFTATETGVYAFDSFGSEFDTVMRAYRSDGSVLTEAAWVKTGDDLAGDTRALLNVRLVAGDTIKLSIASKYKAYGEVNLYWYFEELAQDQWLGDNFGEAIVLDAMSSSVAVTSLGATSEVTEPRHGDVTNNASVWFSLTSLETKEYEIRSDSVYGDTVLALYSGDNLDNLSLLAANDDSSEESYGSRIKYTLEAGVSYYIAVASKEGFEDEITLYYGEGVANDNFVGRLPLTGDSGTFEADFTGATLEEYEPDYEDILSTWDDEWFDQLDFSEDEEAEFTDEDWQELESFFDDFLWEDLVANPITRSLWWEYTPTEDGVLEVSTLGSEVDTALVAFEGDEVEWLWPVEWNDDAEFSLASRVLVPVQAGMTYSIAVLSRDPVTSTINWRFLNTELMNVENDDPDNAISVDAGLTNGSSGSVFGDSTFAEGTEHAAVEEVFSSQSDKRLWWSIEVVDKGFVTIDTIGTDLDTVMEVYEVGPNGNYILLTSNDNFGKSNGSSRVRISVKKGGRYLVAVDSLSDSTGDIVLNYKHESIITDELANDSFNQAIVLNGSLVDITVNNQYAQHQIGEPTLGSVTRPNSIWYEWQAPETGLLTVRSSSESVNTVLGVYQGSTLKSLQYLGGAESQDGDLAQSEVTLVVEKDEYYYIAVATATDEQSDDIALGLSLQAISSEVAQNASIENSQVLDNTVEVISFELTHNSVGLVTGSPLVKGNSSQATSRWYQWQAPEDGEYTFDINESNALSEFEIYQGEVHDAIVLVANSSGMSGEYGKAVFSAKAGQRFYLRLTSGFAYQGEVTLNFVKTGDYQITKPDEVVGAAAAFLPAKITQAGNYSWSWEAPSTGQVGAFVSPVNDTSHELTVFRIDSVNDTKVLLDEVLFDTGNTDAQSSEDVVGYVFNAEKGQKYRVELSATSAILGDAMFVLNYLNATEGSLNAEALVSGMSDIKALVISVLDERYDGYLDDWLIEDEMLPILHSIVGTEDISESDLYFELEVIEEDADVQEDGVAKAEQVRMTVYDWYSFDVLLAFNFNPYESLSAEREVHKRLSVGSGFHHFSFDQNGSNDSAQVAIEMSNNSLKQGVSSAFASVSRKSLEDYTGVALTPEFQLGSLYEVDLHLFDADSVRYDLSREKGGDILNGVTVRIPVDTESLKAWLNDPSLTLVQASEALTEALSEGRLKVVSADSVADLLEARTSDLEGSRQATINLEQKYLEFVTTHFSTFMLQTAQGASVTDDPDQSTTDDIGVEGNSGGGGAFGGALGGSGTIVDLLFYMLLFTMLMVIHRDRVKRVLLTKLS